MPSARSHHFPLIRKILLVKTRVGGSLGYKDFLPEKAQTVSILNGFKNDPFYTHLLTIFTIFNTDVA